MNERVLETIARGWALLTASIASLDRSEAAVNRARSRNHFLALAGDLAATEDQIADLHEHLLSAEPEGGAVHGAIAKRAREAARRVREAALKVETEQKAAPVSDLADEQHEPE